jgi:hypothetical protein
MNQKLTTKFQISLASFLLYGACGQSQVIKKFIFLCCIISPDASHASTFYTTKKVPAAVSKCRHR